LTAFTINLFTPLPWLSLLFDIMSDNVEDVRLKYFYRLIPS